MGISMMANAFGSGVDGEQFKKLIFFKSASGEITIFLKFGTMHHMMSTVAKMADSEIGGWRLSVETMPDIEWTAATMTRTLRAERAEIERVSGFILQRVE